MTNCILWRNPSFNPAGYGSSVAASDPRPSTSRHRFPVSCYQRNAVPIGILLKDSSPSAIRLRIISIVVYAVERAIFAWTLPHVNKKVFELLPSLAVRYTPSTILAVSLVVRIVATTLHAAPCTILWSYFVEKTIAVRDIATRYEFPAKAATTACPSAFFHKRCAKYRPNVSAVALTCPLVAFALHAIKANDPKPAKPFAR